MSTHWLTHFVARQLSQVQKLSWYVDINHIKILEVTCKAVSKFTVFFKNEGHAFCNVTFFSVWSFLPFASVDSYENHLY